MVVPFINRRPVQQRGNASLVTARKKLQPGREVLSADGFAGQGTVSEVAFVRFESPARSGEGGGRLEEVDGRAEQARQRVREVLPRGINLGERKVEDRP
jgi:hypothetical protein